MAAHYDTAIVPARPRKPKGQAKVEGAVLLTERWILARLRNQAYFSLDAQAACRDGVTVLYKRTTRLFDELKWPMATNAFHASSAL